MSNYISCDNEPFGGLESIRYHEQNPAAEFRRFAESRILPMLGLDGYKLKEKQAVALHCVHNLSLAGLRKPARVVADSRDNSRNGLRIAVWDALIKAGLCHIWAEGIQGIPQKVQGGVTRYRATKKLLGLLRLYEQKKYLDLRLDRNTQRKRPTFNAHVILHTGRTDLDTGERLPEEMRKQLVPLSKLPPWMVHYIATQERANAYYNAVMASHSWLMEVPDEIPYEPNYCLRWTHSGRPCHYMRLTGWSAISVGQLSKEERRHLRIDGERTTELDFGSFDIRRHYHFARIDVQGDAYKPQIVLPAFYGSGEARSPKARDIVRKLVKKATNMCLNCPTETLAHSAVGKALRDWPRRKRIFPWGGEREKAFVWRVLVEVERLDGAKGLVRRILRTHRDIRHVFFSEEHGSAMMTLGAAMMNTLRRRFTEADKPVYCIHDAVVCRRSDREFAKATMIDAYHLWVRPDFDPIIHVEF